MIELLYGPCLLVRLVNKVVHIVCYLNTTYHQQNVLHLRANWSTTQCNHCWATIVGGEQST